MVGVPSPFANTIVTRKGEAGREWLRTLPHLVEDLCEEWDLVVDGSVMHGYFSLVIPVRRRTEPYVLKVSWIDDSNPSEVAALLAWDGRGAVHLLEADPSRGAMLLERLNSQRSLNDVEIDKAVPIVGSLLCRLSIPAPTGLRQLQTVAKNFYQASPERWKKCGRPMSRHLLDRARNLAVQLGSSTKNLLVNYDLHYADVLAAEREPWLSVDPRVVVGDPEFGVAQLLWCRLEDIEERRGLEYYFRTLIEVAELDARLARSWSLVRCVQYWLWAVNAGVVDGPRTRIIVNCKPVFRLATTRDCFLLKPSHLKPSHRSRANGVSQITQAGSQGPVWKSALQPRPGTARRAPPGCAAPARPRRRDIRCSRHARPAAPRRRAHWPSPSRTTRARCGHQ